MQGSRIWVVILKTSKELPMRIWAVFCGNQWNCGTWRLSKRREKEAAASFDLSNTKCPQSSNLRKKEKEWSKFFAHEKKLPDASCQYQENPELIYCMYSPPGFSSIFCLPISFIYTHTQQLHILCCHLTPWNQEENLVHKEREKWALTAAIYFFFNFESFNKQEAGPVKLSFFSLVNNAFSMGQVNMSKANPPWFSSLFIYFFSLQRLSQTPHGSPPHTTPASIFRARLLRLFVDSSSFNLP